MAWLKFKTSRKITNHSKGIYGPNLKAHKEKTETPQHVTGSTSFFLFSFFETEGRQAIAKAHETVHHSTSFPSSREEIS